VIGRVADMTRTPGEAGELSVEARAADGHTEGMSHRPHGGVGMPTTCERDGPT
jgi:hypothetical protein